jgi:hypothetical protein
MRIRFVRSVNVEQTPYQAGTEIDSFHLLAGTIESLQKTGAIEEVKEERAVGFDQKTTAKK